MIIDTKKLNQPEWAAALSAFFGGLLVHLFGLVNILHNTDSINYQFTGYGTGASSGRWLLQFLGDFLMQHRMNYNLSLFNGLLFIVFIALSSAVIVSIFHIKHRQIAALLGLVLVSFPTVCSTMLYKFTSAFYGLAFFFSVLAVWILPRRKAAGLFMSACLTTLSLAIYQAYLPVTVSLFVLQLFLEALETDDTFFTLLRKGIYACISILLGLLFYFVCTKLILSNLNLSLNTYQGINNMGKLSLAEIPDLIVRTYTSYFNLALDNYCNLSPNKLLKLSYGYLIVIHPIILVAALFQKNKKKATFIFVLLLWLIFPIAVNLIELMCPESRIYTLMILGCVAVLLAPLVLLQTLPMQYKSVRIFSRITAWVVLIMIVGNTYFTNLTYTKTYYVNRQVENYFSALITQVRMTEDFTPELKWAFIGELSDPLIDNPWQDVTVYGGSGSTEKTLSSYSWKRWFRAYQGYSFEMANNDQIAELMQTPVYQAMPYWPSEGSIKVIDDVVIIKFSPPVA